ncbi:helix-turn-helix domain-containing protein [Halorubrum ezzemoulense]|uniref:Helix-turn-helix domain-containing protein n=1 Tax=Halorubrum ezzemoulense TaxID=337243 RepID=A0A481RIF6_HALEZ|nr:helix-turn-helix domain-containing protein [Halorubrum ezzemoulense]QAY21034.1 helix-turn-helix domain-containing protein [Halorubrum ezzemoulense]
MDPTAAKIVLAAQRGDSINRIASKIDISYSWVYDWMERLDNANIIAKTDNGIQIVDHEMRQQYAEIIAALYSRDTISQEDAYIIPHFAGMEFVYTEIDAAYVWTHGGFQIARSHDDYPVFIEVHDRDVERWIAFFQQWGVDTTINERPDASDVDGNIHYVLYPKTNSIDAEWVDGNPVIPLDDAVSQMMENRPAYEPALEIMADEYDRDIDATHQSSLTFSSA